MGILAFIIVLGVIALVHEWGHFVMARKSGVGVDEFGLGFPPKIWSFKRKETEYSINLLPIGGFVKLHGEQDNENTKTNNSFAAAPFGKKVVILCAGVVMNVILAWLLLSVVMGVGTRVSRDNVPTNGRVITSDAQTLLYTSQGTSAADAGVKNNDILVSINDQKFKNTEDLIKYLEQEKFPVLKLVLIRNEKTITYEIAPKQTADGKKYGIGVEDTIKVRYPWYYAPWSSLKTTGTALGQTFVGIWQLVAGFFRGHVSNDVTGPVGIAVLTNEVQKFGIVSLIQFTAMLSLGFAVLNIIPFPALDGGRIGLLLVGKLIRRNISPVVENAIHTIGFLLIISFAVYLSARDLERYNLINQLIHWFG